MSARADLHRGWCPSFARPMPSGDGLLLRLSLPCGVLPTALARSIAHSARSFGNGLVDLTRHGNLQLRGVSEATLPALRAALCEALPALARERPEAHTIIANPLAGLDPRASCDIRPIVEALEKRLADDPAFLELPAKFSFLIDDGSELALDDVAGDIRFEVRRDMGAPRFAVALGGSARTATPLGSCAASEMPEAAAVLARTFLTLRGTGDRAPRRMAGLLGRVGIEAIAIATSSTFLRFEPASAMACRVGRECPPLIGFHHLETASGFLAIGAPFGRLDADQLDHVAETAEATRAELRVTPWRAVLIASIDEGRARELRPSLTALGLITDADDPRLSVAACPGAPACANASVTTREDAVLLSSFARSFSSEPSRIGLHLSGCPKGCAKSDATPVTLVGRAGRYDVVFDGGAGDTPSHSGLTVTEAKALLSRMHERGAMAAVIGDTR
jgi:precorrin-3B synthase